MKKKGGADDFGRRITPVTAGTQAFELTDERAWTALSTPAFARDWASEADQAYDSTRRMDACLMEDSGGVSPIGSSAVEAAARRAARSVYRAEHERLREPRAIASMVIKLRTKHNLAQPELATIVGTSHSVIARIENGRTRTTLGMLRRIVTAVDADGRTR